MKIRLFIAVAAIFTLTLFGCSGTGNTASNCVKCGNPSTYTLCGPAEQMLSEGISLNKCTQVTSNVYSAPLCDSCMGPVAESPFGN